MPSTEWRRYRVAWRLASPLHIGYRTIGTIARTRLWVPGRNVWGALIDALGARDGEYKTWQKHFADAVRFEAWFIGPAPDRAWQPCWDEHGLQYGAVPERTLQRVVLGANVSTAIEHGRAIAEEGMLFETEYIAPRFLHEDSECKDDPRWQKGAPLWLMGHLWARSAGPVRAANDTLVIAERPFQAHFMRISIGGERAKGYGTLVDCQVVPLDGVYERPLLSIPKRRGVPLLVQWQPECSRIMRGHVEPILGRQTKELHHYGQDIAPAIHYWLPGTVCMHSAMSIELPDSPGSGQFQPSPSPVEHQS
jgi:hypothetical protein